MLLAKAFKVLVACQNVQGGRAQFVAPMSDKGEDKEQIAMLYW